jgi:hypothetical protein
VVGLETPIVPQEASPIEHERQAFTWPAHLFWQMFGMIANMATELPGIIDSIERKSSFAQMI